MRKNICIAGCIIFVFALIVTLAILIGCALIDAIDAGNLIWKAGWIEIVGLVVCAIGSGEFNE